VTLKLELIDDRDIVVSHPESGLSVTYRKMVMNPCLSLSMALIELPMGQRRSSWLKLGKPLIKRPKNSAG
jgi:hypothetical protein